MKGRLDPVRLLPVVLAPIGALLLAVVVSSLVLAVGGKPVLLTFEQMLDYGTQPDSIVSMLNKATPYYLAAIAAAIGFRMGLFNIGVDGQYRLATLLAAALGGASFLGWLPGPVRTLLIIVTAMAVGAAWAGIAAVLKVTRGVNEVISTIMLNVIGGGIAAYLLTAYLKEERVGSNAESTRILPEDSWMPSLPEVLGVFDEATGWLGVVLVYLTRESMAGVFGFLVVAVLAGAVYWFVLGRTRFGFDLRATGLNPSAAVASGVDARRMVLVTMLLSGAVAGLVGMPQLLGESHAYTESVGGLGFTGIGIALLGRNHPIGIAFGALLWGFLERSAQILDLNDIPKETITIMQGTTVLAVVVAYELATRISRRLQQKRVGEATGTAVAGVDPPDTPPAAVELTKDATR
jgi:simple sugar transport system permease protein